MLLNLFNVVYVLIAIAMSVLILLQRGAGAQAGSGFGGGASGTVFGARGATTFLSRSTGILAALFFVLSLGMGVYLNHASSSRPVDDLGVAPVEAPKAPAAAAPAPAANTNSDVPAASGGSADKSVPAATAPVPAANDTNKADVPKPTTAADSAKKPEEPKKH
ncbi:MAG TPA: preprotein translocase subunit SecG [Rudaea sp.]